MNSNPMFTKRMNIWLVAATLFVASPGFVQAQPGTSADSKSRSGGDRTFAVPVSFLRDWSQKILVQLDSVTFTGNSGIHKLANDCEMHFGAQITGYNGDPPGFVMEPMNLCLEKFFGKQTYKQSDWTRFAKHLLNQKLRVEGVLRIWPEHLDGEESLSNPNHALEIHPLTKVITALKTYDFSAFVYAPEGYAGGVGAATARSILEEIEVNVARIGEDVEVDFAAGRIGNFTLLEVRFPRDSIKVQEGGHRVAGEVVFSRTESTPVSLITVSGSGMDDQFKKFMTRKRKTIRLETLALFSLDPQALLRAAEKSAGEKVAVENPIQLILYGVPGDD